ncbi:hypothetical protein HQ590_11050 [bacterium]|nr:hypothetical protein [bacterium]
MFGEDLLKLCALDEGDARLREPGRFEPVEHRRRGRALPGGGDQGQGGGLRVRAEGGCETVSISPQQQDQE